MKKFLHILLFLLACSFLNTTPVHAQFWKKIFKKETKNKPAKKTNNNNKKVSRKDEPKLKSKDEPDYEERDKKEVYRIDVLLPLQLNNLVQNGKPVYSKIPDHMQPPVNFYEGMNIAADSLKSRRYKIELYVHDISNPATSIAQLTSKKMLDSSDLIIGSLQSPDIPAVAAFAKKNKINFISALSPSDAGVKENPYFILIQPTLKTHMHQLIEHADKKFNRSPKYIFHNSATAGEKEAYSQLSDALAEEKHLDVIDCSKQIPSSDSLLRMFKRNEVNVVFISILETAKAEQVLNALAALPREYRFEIFGMPSWKSMRGLTQGGAYMGMSIYYTTPFYFDPTTGPGRYITASYKNSFGGTPSEMVFRGYETLYWTASLLNKYGPVFNKHLSDVSAAQFTRYDIEYSWSKQNDFQYLENNKLYMLHYQNGGFIVED
jgi:ABC-type branched-subunit amino acid transport system substrate-binding protein